MAPDVALIFFLLFCEGGLVYNKLGGGAGNVCSVQNVTFSGYYDNNHNPGCYF